MPGNGPFTVMPASVGMTVGSEFRASALERRTIDRRATDCRRRIASVS
jgi:hypothetical protein